MNEPVVAIGGGSVDTATGVITGGAGGVATLRFDVPVRFDIDKLEYETPISGRKSTL
jgi:hypothetical protein